MSLVALLLLVAAQQEPAESDSKQDDVTVVGQKADRRNGKVEEPYSTTKHIPLGSRIARKTGRRTFNTIATNTGAGGLMFSPGTQIDATGGTVNLVRKRNVKVCKADREEVSEETACALAEAKKKMSEGDHAGASAALAPLLAKRMMSSFDRYYTGYYAYQVAEAKSDDTGREKALAMMLESGRMPEAERLGAMKTMVRLSLKRGDEAAAMASLERLLAVTPNDAESQANLATLYAWNGQHEKAVPRMQTAVSLVQQRGGTPPKDWMEYLAQQKRN